MRSSSSRSGYYYTYNGPFVEGKYGYAYYSGGVVIHVNYGTGKNYYDYQYGTYERNPTYEEPKSASGPGIILGVVATVVGALNFIAYM